MVFNLVLELFFTTYKFLNKEIKWYFKLLLKFCIEDATLSHV